MPVTPRQFLAYGYLPGLRGSTYSVMGYLDMDPRAGTRGARLWSVGEFPAVPARAR
jgi:hypothetical protein